MSKLTIKQQVPTTKVVGLILSWDIIIILGDMIMWGDLSDPMFYSLIWLNAYLLITVGDFKKAGLGFILGEIINTFYDDRLNPSTMIERGKELLGMGANIVSTMSIVEHEKQKKKAEETEFPDPIE